MTAAPSTTSSRPALESQVEAGEKIALANERGTDTAEFETELDNARAEAESASAEYGFEECGAPITATDTSGTAGATDPGATSDPGTVVPAEPARSAPAPAPETGGTGGTGDTGGVGDTGGDTGGGGSPRRRSRPG